MASYLSHRLLRCEPRQEIDLMTLDSISENALSLWIKWATGWAVNRRTRMGQVTSRSARLAVCAVGVSTVMLAASPAGASLFGAYRSTEKNNTRGSLSFI